MYNIEHFPVESIIFISFQNYKKGNMQNDFALRRLQMVYYPIQCSALSSFFPLCNGYLYHHHHLHHFHGFDNHDKTLLELVSPSKSLSFTSSKALNCFVSYTEYAKCGQNLWVHHKLYRLVICLINNEHPLLALGGTYY